jgi:hypothetical protein
MSEEELAAEREKRREKYASLMEKLRARREIDPEQLREGVRRLLEQEER